MPLEDMIKANTPLEAYDRDKLVSYFGAYEDAIKYTYDKDTGLVKNSGNYSTKRDLCGLLFGDPRIAETLPTERVLDYATYFVDKEAKAMAAYCEHNQDKMLEELTDAEMYQLIKSATGVNGVDKEHDELAKIVNEYKKIEAASQSGEGVAAYVNEKKEKFPEWFRESYSQSDAQAFFPSFAAYAENELAKAFFDPKTKKLDRKKAEDFYKANIKKVKEKYDEEPLDDVKKKIRDADINPRYITLAGVLYPRIKPVSKHDKNPEKEDRKKERKDIGMTE